MNRRLVLLVLAASLLSMRCRSSSTAVTPGRRVPTTTAATLALQVEEVRPAVIEEPVTFWRNGQPLRQSETLLIRVRVANPLAFAPQGAPPPTVVLGDVVCEVVESPLATGVLGLLAPRPPEGETPGLALGPRVAPQALTLEMLAAFDLPRAPLPEALRVAPVRYRNLAELKAALAQGRER